MLVSLSDVRSARETIGGDVRQTPVFTATRLGDSIGVSLSVKAELFQRTGSFKVRGALNRIRNANPDEMERGIITISAGNHAQAVAWAAQAAGIPATIVMSESASETKVTATRGYGAEVILVEGDIGKAFKVLHQLQEERQLMLVHPFDDPHIIAGQGTVGLEIVEQVPDVDVIVCPVGGGGLISGVSLAAKSLKPDVRIYGVEPAGAPAMRKAWDSGQVTHLDAINTFADGLGAPMVGNLPLDITREHVEDIILMSEEEIAGGLRALLMYSKLYAEGAGAAATAALVHGKIPVKPGENVVSIVSGGNLDTSTLIDVLSRYPAR